MRMAKTDLNKCMCIILTVIENILRNASSKKFYP
jgi:hypothetical protein